MCLQIRCGEELHQRWLIIPKDKGSLIPSDFPPPALPQSCKCFVWVYPRCLTQQNLISKKRRFAFFHTTFLLSGMVSWHEASCVPFLLIRRTLKDPKGYTLKEEVQGPKQTATLFCREVFTEHHPTTFSLQVSSSCRVLAHPAVCWLSSSQQRYAGQGVMFPFHRWGSEGSVIVLTCPASHIEIRQRI